jgi:hypothetical protein
MQIEIYLKSLVLHQRSKGANPDELGSPSHSASKRS